MLKTLPAFLVLFVAFKLMNIIAWSWLWVLAPLWAPFALFAVFFALLGVIIGTSVTLKTSLK